MENKMEHEVKVKLKRKLATVFQEMRNHTEGDLNSAKILEEKTSY
jgi:hypothetical protein